VKGRRQHREPLGGIFQYIACEHVPAHGNYTEYLDIRERFVFSPQGLFSAMPGIKCVQACFLTQE